MSFELASPGIAHTIIGLRLLASIGGPVTYLFLVDACSAFCTSDLVLIDCQLYLAVLLGASMLPGPVGCAHIVVVWLLQMIFECPALHALSQQYAPLLSTNTDTMRSLFAQNI